MNDMEFKFESQSPGDTSRIGVVMGDLLQPSTVIGLTGTLGAGKTQLVQAIGEGIGVPEGNVVSPTFTICVPHAGRVNILHVDAYRIKSLAEVDDLALDESVDEGAVLIVEWVERIEEAVPPLDVQITIEHSGDQSRRLAFQALTEKGRVLVRILRETFAA